MGNLQKMSFLVATETKGKKTFLKTHIFDKKFGRAAHNDLLYKRLAGWAAGSAV